MHACVHIIMYIIIIVYDASSTHLTLVCSKCKNYSYSKDTSKKVSLLQDEGGETLKHRGVGESLPSTLHWPMMNVVVDVVSDPPKYFIFLPRYVAAILGSVYYKDAHTRRNLATCMCTIILQHGWECTSFDCLRGKQTHISAAGQTL